MTCIQYAPDSKQAQEYRKLAEKIHDNSGKGTIPTPITMEELEDMLLEFGIMKTDEQELAELQAKEAAAACSRRPHPPKPHSTGDEDHDNATTIIRPDDGEFHKRLIAEVLEAYPDKIAQAAPETSGRRSRRGGARGGPKPADDAALSECEVKSNIKSIPGVMTIRGCAYAGSKGVVWGPVKDMVHISHGPVGCGHYSWSQRRNYYIGTTGVDTFVTMQFTSDFQEKRHRLRRRQEA